MLIFRIRHRSLMQQTWMINKSKLCFHKSQNCLSNSTGKIDGLKVMSMQIYLIIGRDTAKHFACWRSTQRLTLKAYILLLKVSIIYESILDGMIYFVRGDTIGSDFGFPRLSYKKQYKWYAISQQYLIFMIGRRWTLPRICPKRIR